MSTAVASPNDVRGGSIDVINPSTEECVSTFADTPVEEVDRIVAGAVKAAPDWANAAPAERASCLREMARRIEADQEQLAKLDAIDSGNPLTAMRGDVRSAIRSIDYFAGLATEAKGLTLPLPDSRMVYTRRESFGVAARIIPFNHPAQFAAAKVAAPLAAGNAVVLKPAEQTSLSALHLRDLLDGVFPDSVLNIVPGYGHTVGSALVQHPDIPRIAFTGSVPTGQRIMADAAPHLKSLSLELGGKNPMVVFPDVDAAAAAAGAVDGMNFRRSQGQSCGSNSRVFVHESIYAAFVDALIPMLKGIVVGDASDEQTEMGPLAFRAQYEKVMRYIDAGTSEGARLLTGGRRPTGLDRGFFVEPTLFGDVDMSMTIAQDEIFGPVLSLFKWRDLDDVVAQANATPLGLTANIWTNDLAVAHQTATRIRAGYVWINGRGGRPLGASFGGFGLSGLGKENSLEELLSYTREKTVDVTFPGWETSLANRL